MWSASAECFNEEKKLKKMSCKQRNYDHEQDIVTQIKANKGTHHELNLNRVLNET